ncbi:hypothetical protein T05_15828, partial [Trichinella murrelli]
MGREFSVDGGGKGGRVYIFVGVEGIVTGLQFCLGGWKFGRVYNSVRVEGMAGGYTILLGWREWRTDIQSSMGGEGSGGREYNSVWWRECHAGNFGWVYNSLWVEEGVAGEYTLLLEWREWRAGIQFCLGGGNGCQVNNLFRMEGMAGRVWQADIPLFVWRTDYQFAMQHGMGEGGIGGTVYNSVWVEGMVQGISVLLSIIGVVGIGKGVSRRMCKGQSGGQVFNIFFYSEFFQPTASTIFSVSITRKRRGCSIVCQGFTMNGRIGCSLLDFIVVTICNIDATLNFCELMQVFSSFNHCLVGGSGGAGCTTLLVEGLAKDLKLCMGGADIGGAVYNSVWVEYNVAGGYTILFGWRRETFFSFAAAATML